MDTLLAELFADMEEYTTNPVGYPPVNIIQEDEETNLLEMAVAGFSMDQLDITVANHTLTISGKIDKPRHEEKKYLQRGIGMRSFKRTFKLSEYWVVDGAKLENGLLTVILKLIVPEERKPRKIEIK